MSVDVPVLIVGAGPAGLMASLLLEQLGVSTRVIDRRPTHKRAPAAHVVNARTFELCRAVGVDMEAAKAAWREPIEAGWAYFVTKLGGTVLGRLPFERQGDAQRAVTPTPLRNISQDRFEPLLLDALAKTGRSPDWNTQWESLEDTGECVVSQILDRTTGETEVVRSHYVLAADGASSRIRRGLAIVLDGPDQLQTFRMIHFNGSLRERVGTPAGLLFFQEHPDASGVFVIHDLDSEAVYMHAFDPERESVESFDEERCREIVRGALEDPDFEFEIASLSTWTMTAQVAKAYRKGRVFLVGDSAHRFPPTGGLGLNSGVQDAHNLAWKLAFVLDGRARPEILDTFESERRPVAQNNAEQSLRNATRLLEVPQALGVIGAQDPVAAMEQTLADPESRLRVEEAVLAQAEHFDLEGLHLGFVYTDGVLHRGAGEPAPVPDPPRAYQPSGAPGRRFPHAWLSDGTSSTLDWIALDRFLLLAGPDGDAWVAAVESMGDPRLSARKVTGEDLPGLSEWLASCGIKPSGALLVRPDQHVAWRAPSSSGEAVSEFGEVWERILPVA